MAGARSFIRTKLFVALEKSVSQIEEQVAALEESQLRTELSQLWETVTVVVSFLKRVGKQRDNAQIDRAFNLLYLTSGVAYHRVASEMPDKPAQNERYSSV